MKKTIMRFGMLVAIAGALGFVGGCSESQKKSGVVGALLGVGLGAGVGGLVGKSAGSALAGAAIGGIAGGGIGAALGDSDRAEPLCQCCSRHCHKRHEIVATSRGV